MSCTGCEVWCDGEGGCHCILCRYSAVASALSDNLTAKVFREGKRFHQGEVGKYLLKEKIQGNIYSSLFPSAGFYIHRAFLICFCAKEVLVDC